MNKKTYSKHNCLAILGSILLFCLATTSVQAQSLYEPGKYRSWVADHVASKVGDSLTVVVLETASASADAGSSTERSTGLNAKLNSPNTNFQLGAGFGRENEGVGSVKRKGNLKAQLSVVVHKVLENGDLHLRGSQYIKVNDEEQRILLSGIVRPEDISSNNVVLSTRLRNVAIEYSGEGFIAENQKPGILARVLQWLGF